MTKKDYVAIAAAFAATDNLLAMKHAGLTLTTLRVGTKAAAENVAHMLAADNALFDRARFLAACGVA